MQTIELIALDLDGTLFNNQSIITQENIDTINQAIEQGVTVVISTGRPFSGLPIEQLSQTKIQYAITTNGSAVYEIATKKLIYEDCMDNSVTFPIIDFGKIISPFTQGSRTSRISDASGKSLADLISRNSPLFITTS